VGGHPRGFLERGPAAEIIFDIASEFDEEALDPGFRNELHHVIDADERDKAKRAGRGGHGGLRDETGYFVALLVNCQQLTIS